MTNKLETGPGVWHGHWMNAQDWRSKWIQGFIASKIFILLLSVPNHSTQSNHCGKTGLAIVGATSQGQHGKRSRAQSYFHSWSSIIWGYSTNSGLYFFNIYLFGSTRLKLLHVESSSLTRYWIQAPCIGSLEC